MRPIYSTSGDWVALFKDGYLYDTYGEWVGWVEGQDVYTRDGEYVGYLSDDGRILRSRIRVQRPLHRVPPTAPGVRPPPKVPLAPSFVELPWNVVDVFDEDPGLFHRISDLRPDWED